jgi:GntR family transcriptional regulator
VLEKTSFVPLYYQLKEELKDKIESGDWRPHDRVPSVRELCEFHGISTTTAKQAISELIHEGLLYTVQGKGTFLSPTFFPVAYRETTRISDEMRLATRIRSLGSGFRAEVLSVDDIACPGGIAGYLSVDHGTMMYRIRRLKRVDEKPMLIETTFIPVGTCPGLHEKDLSKSLFGLLSNHYGIKLATSEEAFRPVFLDNLEAGLLEQPEGCLALLNERVSFAGNSRPVLYARSMIRGDMCKLYIDLTNMRSMKDLSAGASSF